MEVVEKLIDAMVAYGIEFCWNDSDIIEQLIDCGLTENDFKECNRYEFVKEYFESN